ncbi:MAG: hypothetical protein LQ343_003213 [Gyalolechia ehrenbergii]|nr:MAG: hypothetical protein LQ343_003213 [Gyalolechia ehrenbergii]
MNHESSDSAFDVPSSSHHSPGNRSTSQSPQEPEATTTAGRADVEQQAKKVIKEYKAKFLEHLIRQLDVVIYCELSILYYMDCSLFSFLARALNHWFYLTPKPALVSPIITWNRPHVVMIFALNLLSIFFHTISIPPTAGEAVRGYLYGGLLIDFVGQKSPVPRWRLVGYDVLILMLQVVMLGVTVEKKKLDVPSNGFASGGQGREEQRQDLDSEERGVRRSEDGSEGMELQPIGPRSGGRSGGRPGGEEDGERDELLEVGRSTIREHPGDAFYSGQYMLANIHIVNIIRDQWRQSRPTATGNSVDGSVRAAAAAELARRRLRFRIRIGGRDYGS